MCQIKQKITCSQEVLLIGTALENPEHFTADIHKTKKKLRMRAIFTCVDFAPIGTACRISKIATVFGYQDNKQLLQTRYNDARQ